MNKLFRNKWLYIALIAGACYYVWQSHRPAQNAPSQTATRVSTKIVERKDAQQNLEVVGNVVAYETVGVRSRLDSQIVDVKFKDGDMVQEGQVLFVLDDRTVKAQLAQLNAALQKERATLVDSKLQYERAQKLFEKNVMAQASVDNAKASYQAQLAQVNAAQASMDSAAVLTTYSQITAPITGRAGTINVTRGNTVKANDQPLVTINQVSPIRVQISIPQRYYEQVRDVMQQGIAVEARRDESPQVSKGKLEYLDNNINTSNGTFTARALFTNEDETLWPGMFVNTRLTLGTIKNAVLIPSVSLQGDEGAHFVFTVEGSKAVRKPIEVGDRIDDTVVVTKGLNGGEQIITDGLLRVTDGADVEVNAPAPATVTPAP